MLGYFVCVCVLPQMKAREKKSKCMKREQGVDLSDEKVVQIAPIFRLIREGRGRH